MRYSYSERVHLGMGPSISYLVHVNNILDGKRSNSKSTFTKLDFGFNGDIAYSLSKFEVGARYYYGVRTIRYSGPDDPEFNIAINEALGKNRSIQIYLCYVFEK